MAAVNFLASKMKQFFRTVGRHNQHARKVNRMCACTRAKMKHQRILLRIITKSQLEKPYYWKGRKYNKMATITANDWPRSLRILIYLFLMEKMGLRPYKRALSTWRKCIKRVNNIYICTSLTNFHAFVWNHSMDYYNATQEVWGISVFNTYSDENKRSVTRGLILIEVGEFFIMSLATSKQSWVPRCHVEIESVYVSTNQHGYQQVHLTNLYLLTCFCGSLKSA